MKRRDSIKTIVLGTIGTSTLIQSCKIENKDGEKEDLKTESPIGLYGRSIEEKERDQKLMDSPSAFNDAELTTIGALVDIILPVDSKSGSAKESGVVDFIDFISKDIEEHFMPLKSGIAWLNRKSNDLHGKQFNDVGREQQISIVELIAYPFDALPENKAGAKFFSKMRDLTLTGFYTSKEGLIDIGYVGNTPNFWNGVPDDILKTHGFEYEDKYLKQYVDEHKRNEVATWDEDGNLI